MVPNSSRSKSSGMRYERLFPLGSGGMATVELALAKGPGGFNRLVVLKSMRKELAGNEDSYAMFLEEARLSARLNHPNVVQVSEVLETNEGIVLVMEYLEGVPLSAVYRTANEALTLPMRLRLIGEVLAGLHYAHELTDFNGKPLGVVHRDVSPQNVFVTYDGRIKLLDFGIAKASDSSEQTRAGLIKGRIAYMPAEQLSGIPVDRRSDIYAVGCLLWEALAGARMWADQTERDIARGVLSGKVPALGSRVKVDPELERIVVRAMALDPNARYATAEEMRVEIENFLAVMFPSVTARDIGEMLSSLSVEARENRRRAIANAIAVLEANGDEVSQRSVVHSITPPQQRLSRMRLKADAPDGTGSGPARTSSTPSSGRIAIRELPSRHPKGSLERASRSNWWPLAVLAGVALVGFALWFGAFARAPGAATATAVANSVAPSSPPSFRSLRVEVTPEDARIFVDEQLVRGNPAMLSVGAGTEHVVRAERDGFDASTRRVSVVDNVELRIELSARKGETQLASEASEPTAPPSKLKAKARHASTANRLSASAAPSKAPSVSKDCDPPYYFSNGNKTYKPECI